MKIKCKLGFHTWEGCKCKVCGKFRNKLHDWSYNCEKCSVCSKTRENHHDWSKDCEECAKCGETRKEKHTWEGCKCTKCGYEHSWQKDIEGCVRCGKVVEISTLQELQSINNDLKAHYRLITNIDATETKNWNNGDGFTPIGTKKNNFIGILNGDNFNISNLYINRVC